MKIIIIFILLFLAITLWVFWPENKPKDINYGNLTGSGSPISEMTDAQKYFNQGGFSGISSNDVDLQGGSGGMTDGKTYYGTIPSKKQPKK